MLVVISPAKRLNWSETPGLGTTEPRFREDANYLAGVARRLPASRLQSMMGISAKLARLSQQRFASFADDPGTDVTRPSIRAFAGDTYAGLEAASLDPEELLWAQDHLRILSGLYGSLRPLDGIQPYRLEMGTRLRTRAGDSLYAYWGHRIAKSLMRDAGAVGTDVLVNCASQEYFGAVAADDLPLQVVTPVFLEDRPDGPKSVSVFLKRARGAMARFIVQRRLTDPGALRDFDMGHYAFRADLSTTERPVFVRRVTAHSAA